MQGIVVGAVIIGVAASGHAIGSAANLPANSGTELRPGLVPAEYQQWVIQAGRMCPQITSPLIAAQIKNESSFDKYALSPAGAQGPAQFMPSTWALYGHDDSGTGAASPFDIGDAVSAQGRFMCDIAAEIDAGIAQATIAAPDGPVELYLAAYNAGLGAVQESGGFPSYSETRHYADQICSDEKQFTFDQ
ncbi:lytic transglycosylase domain-containing protein [Rhodococcus jostii]|uniref:lytic transglycosylase domain-containing protein n=1 Tax=Rhodococcus jostii TaxID=132919 RepID=UPI00363CF6BF